MDINALIKTFLTVLAIAFIFFGLIWYPMFTAWLMLVLFFGILCVGLYEFYKQKNKG